MKVPFMNLKRQNDALAGEYLEAVRRVIDSGAFILGREVNRFEEGFAGFQGAKFCAATSSGTSALHLALLAAGIGPGDEVITAPNSFVATSEAIVHCGAAPVFVDVNPDTYQMEPELIGKAVTPKTRAILPVHLYGCPSPMKEIMAVAEKHGLTVIEDACQAHGAELGGKPVGGFGAAAAFSFYPGKNLGALGDGGAVVTNDEALYRKVCLLRDHGSSRKYEHEMVGYNYRMSAITGATLAVKLGHLARWTETRQARAALYARHLSSAGLKLPVAPKGAKHVFHLFVVQCEARDRLAEYLNQRGIGTGIHYPVPIHVQRAFAFLGHQPGDFPVTEAAAKRILSLPMCSEITEEEVAWVCGAIKEGLKELSLGG